MKKKLTVKALILLVVLALTSGCIKVETGMKISLTGNVEGFYIMGIMESMLGQTGSPAEAFKTDVRKLEDQGYKVSDYKEDGYAGFKATRDLGKLEDLSYEGSVRSVDLDKVDANTKYFKVEKGFLKNTYTAKFTTSVSKDVMNEVEQSQQDETNPDEEEVELDLDVEPLVEEDDDEELEDDAVGKDQSTTNEEGTDNQVDEQNDDTTGTNETDAKEDETKDDGSIIDDDTMEQIKSMMKVVYKVSLPTKVISSNATKVSSDGKDLEWNLIDWKEGQTIEFTFEVWNVTNVLIVGGIALLILVVLIVMFVVSRKSKKEKATAKTDEVKEEATKDEKESALTPVEPVDGVNALNPVGSESGPVTLEVPKIEEVQKPIPEVAKEETPAPVTVEVPQIVDSPVIPVEPKTEEAKTE